jgi:hypothetical protein
MLLFSGVVQLNIPNKQQRLPKIVAFHVMRMCDAWWCDVWCYEKE